MTAPSASPTTEREPAIDAREAKRAEIARIAEELDARAEALVRELLPAARREGPHWRCGSLAGEAGQSLCVTVAGDRQGFWKDFASGEHGDMLDLVREVRYRGDKAAALQWARAWLGITDETPAPARPRPMRTRAPQAADDSADRSRFAQSLWLTARPILRGTVAARYLGSRGIELAELGRQPRALRFLPALDHIDRATGEVTTWPALLAAITGADGAFLAVHRTWLAPDGRGKAPVANPKMTLGRYAGGCIRLWRGAGSKPLREAKPGEAVVVTEGLEDGLSVAVADPAQRVLVAVSLSNMGAMQLPGAIARVTIMAQNDAPGSQAEQGLKRAVENFQRQGKAVFIARLPPGEGKDANDALVKWRAEQREGAG